MQARGTALLLVLGAMALGAATAACTSTTTGAQQSSSGGGSGSGSSGGSGSSSGSSSGGGSSGGSAPLTCLGILQCVQSNNCSTDACVNGCLTQGTSDAQQQVTDLANCYTNASCSDSACLQTNCPSQLQACLSGSTPPATGQPLGGGGAPAGSVPSDWVGSWTAGDAFDLTAEQQFDFGADGSGVFTDANTGGLGDCESTILIKYAGTAVIDESAATITIYATDVSETTEACGQSSTVPQPAKTLNFTYEPDPQGDGGIMITDSDCAAQYSGDPASANLYCRYTYRKQ